MNLNQSRQSARHSNIELLRIISILFIILFHYCSNFNYAYAPKELAVNRFVLQILSSPGNAFLSTFIIITGYYSVKRGPSSGKRLTSLYFLTLFYSLIGLLAAFFLTPEQITPKNVIKTIFPMIFEKYWFVTMILICVPFIPFINKLIDTLSKENLFKLICMTIFIWLVIPTFTTQSMGGTYVTYFLILYLTGAFIRLYYIKREKTDRRCLIVLLILFVFQNTSMVILNFLGTRWVAFMSRTTILSDRMSVFSIIAGIAIFILALNFEVNPSKVINTVSSYVFDVYLIHFDVNISFIIWRFLIPVNQLKYNPWLFLHAIASVMIVFVFCTVIGYIRSLTIGKIIDVIAGKTAALLSFLAKRVYQKLMMILDIQA